MVRVASGRASAVKRAKSMMQDRLAVATPDKRERLKKEEVVPMSEDWVVGPIFSPCVLFFISAGAPFQPKQLQFGFRASALLATNSVLIAKVLAPGQKN